MSIYASLSVWVWPSVDPSLFLSIFLCLYAVSVYTSISWHMPRCIYTYYVEIIIAQVHTHVHMWCAPSELFVFPKPSNPKARNKAKHRWAKSPKP